jgi:predicted XRE-type DNA-binding protein
MKRRPGSKRPRKPNASPTRTGRTRRAGQRSIRNPSRSIVAHVTAADGNVFADLGFPPEEAANLALRSDLMAALIRATRKMPQAAAAALLGVRQPRVSDLKRGQIDRFTIDALVNMLAHAGGTARLIIKTPKVTAA